MKKITVGFFYSILMSCAANAGSAINLPLPANSIIVAKSELALSVDTLTADVPYRVSCTLDAGSAPRIDISVTPALAHDGGFGVLEMNGEPALKNIGSLHEGSNTVTFIASIPAKKDNNHNAIHFKNLDDRYTASIKRCNAQPVTNVSAHQEIERGGYFYVSNHLPYFVDITVGTFFPTPYCLYPYTRQYITTSTAYQDIDIVGTHY